MEPYVVDDAAAQRFRVNRHALVDAEVLALEQQRIFARSWLYLGHASELKAPGDFRTRTVGGRPLIFCRAADGALRAYLNSCLHRGAKVCREGAGRAERFYCFYHGWTYGLDGALVNVPGQEAYGAGFRREDFRLREAPRLEQYRDFVFVSFDPAIEPLADYLAGAREYIDLVVDQSPSGRMEVLDGSQVYDIRANWKLLVENSFDDYHLPSTHSTWLNWLRESGHRFASPKGGLMLPAHGLGIDLGRGHAVVDNKNFRGRPVAAWMPVYGEGAKAEIDAIRAELAARLGEARAERVANTNRNLVVFPNLVINDGSSVTIRAFAPLGPDRMRVTAWALGPVEESATARARRLDSFLTFYGPGGFATPDDVEALEAVQEGLATVDEIPWSEMSRGMNRERDHLNTDEHHLRAFWREWQRRMAAA